MLESVRLVNSAMRQHVLASSSLTPRYAHTHAHIDILKAHADFYHTQVYQLPRTWTSTQRASCSSRKINDVTHNSVGKSQVTVLGTPLTNMDLLLSRSAIYAERVRTVLGK